MRFAAIIDADGAQTVAVEYRSELVNAAVLLDVPELHTADLFDEPRWLPQITAALLGPIPENARLDPEAISWLAPSPRPSKIIGVALNNQLGSQFAVRTPTEPAYFLKPPSALVGHLQPIVVPAEYGLTHPEPELAAVIGRRCRNLSVEDALEAVFGFTIINDITSPGLKDRDSMELALPVALGPAPDWRRVHGADDYSLYLTYHARSKGCDTFAPMGPWLVTPDKIPELDNLRVQGLLDGAPVLDDSTANLRFSVPQVLSHLSHSMTLEPGDVVHFGSAFMPADPERFPNVRTIDISQLNGTLSVEIQGIGRLDNPIAHA